MTSQETFRPTVVEGDFNASGLRFCIIASRFNAFVVDALIEGAVDCIRRHGGEVPTVVRVPGAWELPVVARAVAKTGKYHAIIALGAVIRGSTPHFDYVAGEGSSGLSRVMAETGVPIAFGVITTENIEQAIERSGTKMGNKGWDAALSAIETSTLLRTITSL